MFDRTKSTIRYLPPNGTAGLARSRVSGCSRVPCPPAIISANVLIWAKLIRSATPQGVGTIKSAGNSAFTHEYKGACAFRKAHAHIRRRLAGAALSAVGDSDGLILWIAVFAKSRKRCHFFPISGNSSARGNQTAIRNYLYFPAS